MKGPGLRIDVDTRRAWRCPTCGQSQRLPMDITAPRCPCVRDGVPMKLAEGRRPGRRDLRPELRSMLDRIQGGEEFPRLVPLIASESEAGSFGGTRSTNRPPRSDRGRERTREAPREPLPQRTEAAAMPEQAPPSIAPTVPPPETRPAEDDFGAGLGAE